MLPGVRPLIGLVVAALLVVLSGGAVARTSAATTATTVLVATDDGTVSSTRRTKTFGNAPTLLVDSKPVLRSYLKFDLSSIDGTLTRARLRLTATSAGRVGFGVRAVADSSWNESKLTYAKAPALSGLVGRSGRPFVNRALSLDVTASVKAGIHSFALVGRGAGVALSVASSENGKAAARPRLVVTSTVTPPEAPTGPCGFVATKPKKVDHVIWIWMENKPFSFVIGSPSAPYENQLARHCGLATNYHAVMHPSLPNYIAATSGSPQGIADDNSPSSHPLGVASIYSQVKAAGKTWRDYQESASGNCPLISGGRYAVKHDPAPYYTRIRSDCALWDVPLGTTSAGNLITDLTNNTLPAFSFVTPNLCNDTHDCSVATGDGWLKSWFAKILTSPSYTAGRTVVFLTWDEDDGSASNRVPLIVISPSTPAGTRSGTAFDHYALLKTTEQLLGIRTFLGHAGDTGTSSMIPAFNLG